MISKWKSYFMRNNPKQMKTACWDCTAHCFLYTQIIYDTLSTTWGFHSCSQNCTVRVPLSENRAVTKEAGLCSHSWSHSPPRPNKSDKQRLLKQCCIWHSRCQMAALCSHNLFTPSHASHAALPPQPCCPPTDDQEPTQHFPFHPTLQLNCPGGSHNAEHRCGPGLKHPHLLYSISNNYDNDLSF